jgi:hypothetical protein
MLTLFLLTVDSGQFAVDSGQFAVDSGQLTVFKEYKAFKGLKTYHLRLTTYYYKSIWAADYGSAGSWMNHDGVTAKSAGVIAVFFVDSGQLTVDSV